MGESRALRGKGDGSCKIYRPCQSWGQDSQARDGPLPSPRVLQPSLGHVSYRDVRWPGAAMGWACALGGSLQRSMVGWGEESWAGPGISAKNPSLGIQASAACITMYALTL